MRESVQAPANHRYSLPLIGALIALAWLALWAWGQSPYDRSLSHHQLEELHNGGLLLLFIACWTVMSVAMLLPSTMPLVYSFYTLTSRPVDRGKLPTLLVVCYL